MTAGRVALGEYRRGADASAGERRAGIEAPYLQLVLRASGTRSGEPARSALRLADARAARRRRADRPHAPRRRARRARRRPSRTSRRDVFRYLVTPSGTKIAHRVADLADYAERPRSGSSRCSSGSPAARASLRAAAGEGALRDLPRRRSPAPILDWRARVPARPRARRRRGAASAAVAPSSPRSSSRSSPALPPGSRSGASRPVIRTTRSGASRRRRWSSPLQFRSPGRSSTDTASPFRALPSPPTAAVS